MASPSYPFGAAAAVAERRCALCNCALVALNAARASPCGRHSFCIKCTSQGSLAAGCPLCAFSPPARAAQLSADSSLLTVDTTFLLGNLLDSVSLNVNGAQPPPAVAGGQVLQSADYRRNLSYLVNAVSGIQNADNIRPAQGVSEQELVGAACATSPATPARSAAVLCASCADGMAAHSRCDDCQEALCVSCVQAHQRVRLTRDHRIIPLATGSAPPSGNTSRSSDMSSASPSATPTSAGLDGAILFASHKCVSHGEPTVFCCRLCSNRQLCVQCLPGHADHSVTTTADKREAVQRMLIEAKQYERALDETHEAVARMNERVETRVQAVSNEVRAVLHHHISALEERKHDLLQRVDQIREAKVRVLQAQSDQLRSRLAGVRAELAKLDAVSDSDVAFGLLLGVLSADRLYPAAHETDGLTFVTPDAALIAALRELGEIQSGASADQTTVVGESHRRAIRDRVTMFTVQARDATGAECRQGGEPLQARIESPARSAVNVQFDDKGEGSYVASYVADTEGDHLVDVRLRGRPIAASPFKVNVRDGRDYTLLIDQPPQFSIGGEGVAEGQLCRPWGVCVDRLGRVIVADRSNNRIQMFYSDGTFIKAFGCSGTRAGQFDRPAGVAVNSKNYIVVADKDNHRIQVFDAADSSFVFKFGEKGRGVGQFNYPWDVAIDATDQIAVTDTRNHRVQLFGATGQFVRKFGLDNSLFSKHFDSPRGICFLHDGQLLVSDFNNHRLVVMSASGGEMKFVGREGDWDGAFRRPQGVDVDAEGHVLVADSRNNRVQVLTPDLRPLCSIEGGRAPLMDRPCDVCAAPDGRLLVVDFGNNKLHAF